MSRFCVSGLIVVAETPLAGVPQLQSNCGSTRVLAQSGHFRSNSRMTTGSWDTVGSDVNLARGRIMVEVAAQLARAEDGNRVYRAAHGSARNNLLRACKSAGQHDNPRGPAGHRDRNRCTGRNRPINQEASLMLNGWEHPGDGGAGEDCLCDVAARQNDLIAIHLPTCTAPRLPPPASTNAVFSAGFESIMSRPNRHPAPAVRTLPHGSSGSNGAASDCAT